eukprot:TRINITY_DN32123_c0_g1_i1.p1 TRINITY_DN32123_c0_g1~~TRINITY_DN32123_c0_g1_i1.p1  ORF type:complete len:167 (+),score=19.04 TRINITY_DN32123_c0_g1_i1:71-571(+)
MATHRAASAGGGALVCAFALGAGCGGAALAPGAFRRGWEAAAASYAATPPPASVDALVQRADQLPPALRAALAARLRATAAAPLQPRQTVVYTGTRVTLPETGGNRMVPLDFGATGEVDFCAVRGGGVHCVCKFDVIPAPSPEPARADLGRVVCEVPVTLLSVYPP